MIGAAHLGVIAAATPRATGGGGFPAANPGAPGAYRYARLLCKTGASYYLVAEFEVRETIGGSDVTTGGTASASASQGGAEVPASAFDNNDSTHWAASNGGERWLQYDFGASNARTIAEVALKKPVSWELPTSFDILGSNDGTNFDLLLRVPFVINGLEPSLSLYTIPVRQWRVNITANNGHALWTQINELEFLASGAPQSPVPGACIASKYQDNTNETPKNAFDANTSTGWTFQGTPAWIAQLFQSDPGIDAVRITGPSDVARAPKDFTVDYSDDGGETWTTVLTISGETGWAANEVRTFT